MKFTFATEEEGFDAHINASIRGYDNLRNDVYTMSQYFVEDYTNVYDIGCSSGEMIDVIWMNSREYAPMAEFIGIEVEEDFYPSLDSKKGNRLSFYKGDVLDFVSDDSLDWGGFHNASYVMSIFTLQFMPLKYRKSVVSAIYNGLNSGGAFVVAEKHLSEDAKLQDMMTFMYYDYKSENFTNEQILEKEQRLRHMLKPQTEKDFCSMLSDYKWSVYPTAFWQNFNFKAYIMIK